MKKIATLIAIAAIFIAMVSFKISHTFPFNSSNDAVTATSVSGLEEVINALRSGNAVELGRYIDENIAITLPDKSDTYSKAQAVMILRDFFASNGVRSFEVKHKGDSEGSQFCVGVLHTRSGDYRTTIFMKTSNRTQVVKEIRFQSM